ncbi:pyrin-like [Sorex araneus]|uniref:pyrin-like n=1 Tax=Sorex araneus TaxID=42254 RepID=UPI002433D48B|nr:pyrin-like [Sorex araneus]
MEEIVADNLLHSLQELLPNEFEVFKLKLQNTRLENEPPQITRRQLHEATPVQMTDLLLRHYGQISAVLLTLKILKKMNLELLVQKLKSALVPESLSSQQLEPSLTQTNWVPAGAKQGRRVRLMAISAGRLQNLGGSVWLREGLRSSGKERPEPGVQHPLRGQGARPLLCASSPGEKEKITPASAQATADAETVSAAKASALTAGPPTHAFTAGPPTHALTAGPPLLTLETLSDS